MTEKSSDRNIYRSRVHGEGLVGFSLRVEQTDLFIRAETDLTSRALDLVLEGRRRIEHWVETHPDFLTSLVPLPRGIGEPRPMREMLAAGDKAGVGPMAAVAGAMAEFVGRGLKPFSPAGVVVENGGDIYLDGGREMVAGIYAGSSPLSLKLGIKVPADRMPVGLCTSAGTVGHSFSRGRSDAAMVMAVDAALADAAATALGNRVGSSEDIQKALEWGMSLRGVVGAAIIVGEHIGFMGDLDVVPLV